jgi:transposase
LAETTILTFRYRVKDSASRKHLRRMALAVNNVWNWCSGAQDHARKHNARWPNFVKLCAGLSGSSKEGLGIGSDVFQAVARQWCASRDKAKRRPRWRSSVGKKRSLGWVPFQTARAIQISGDTVKLGGKKFRLWLHRPIGGEALCGSFNEDASGRWFLNLQCLVPADRAVGNGEVGIDLGLKDFAALSDGSKIANPRYLRKSAARLAKAQRAGRKALARKINRKIAAQRRHFLHTESTRIARTFQFVAVGDVNSAKLAKTRMAKSVLDAGWSSFRGMLKYKMAMAPGARYIEASERYSTQTCSACGSRCGSPRGVQGLQVREWVCDGCGVLHDRDTNASLNILFSGRSAALHLTESRLLLGTEGVTAHLNSS